MSSKCRIWLQRLPQNEIVWKVNKNSRNQIDGKQVFCWLFVCSVDEAEQVKSDKWCPTMRMKTFFETETQSFLLLTFSWSFSAPVFLLTSITKALAMWKSIEIVLHLSIDNNWCRVKSFRSESSDYLWCTVVAITIDARHDNDKAVIFFFFIVSFSLFAQTRSHIELEFISLVDWLTDCERPFLLFASYCCFDDIRCFFSFSFFSFSFCFCVSRPTEYQIENTCYSVGRFWMKLMMWYFFFVFFCRQFFWVINRTKVNFFFTEFSIYHGLGRYVCLFSLFFLSRHTRRCANRANKSATDVW